jgi:formylmethanofuran dehydrogenase subunit A
MITCLAGGRLVDPVQGAVVRVQDLFFEDDRIIAPPPGAEAEVTYDVSGCVIMAGALDIHSHVAGGKVNLARLVMTADHRHHIEAHEGGARSGSGHVSPSSFSTGHRYARMGYSAAFEPAMVPSNARSTHLEMADLPIVDKGAYVMLGSDEFLLRRLAAAAGQSEIDDYVAWMMQATLALGVKVVNPGGISAFKFNGRSLDIDQGVPHHGVPPRRILQALARAIVDLGVPHPLHVHCNNLGVPGNVDTTLATIDAAEGLPMHLTHVQFHSYGREGDRHFSSAAARIAEAVNRNPNISIDVGQVVFGETITASGDTMAQYRNRRLADPDKWILMDIECDGGCGLVPFRYRDKNFVNALQWAIGLELFLLIEDPWRIFLTTDHPNGGPFTSYPQLVKLLMNRQFRNDCLARLPVSVRKATILGTIEREYTLHEIAIMTRAAPARILGLADHGHLSAGAVADVTVYRPDSDIEAMFAEPVHVFRRGVEVARVGQLKSTPAGVTHVVRPAYDRAIERRLRGFFDEYMTIGFDHFALSAGELADAGLQIREHPCRAART